MKWAALAMLAISIWLVIIADRTKDGGKTFLFATLGAICFFAGSFLFAVLGFMAL